MLSEACNKNECLRGVPRDGELEEIKMPRKINPLD
jgi:hypothetical protein